MLIFNFLSKYIFFCNFFLIFKMKISTSSTNGLSPLPTHHTKTKSSLNTWMSQDIKSPKEFQINQVFNSIKDVYDKENIVEAIKKIKSVNDRLHFIDLLVKRKEEIASIEEMAQISKLGPIFEKVRQKFMKRIKEKKNMIGQYKTRSSLFRKNSLMTSGLNIPSGRNFELRKDSGNESGRERKNSDIPPTDEEIKKAAQRRATVLNVVTGLSERKFYQPKQEKKTDLMLPFMENSANSGFNFHFENKKKSVPKLVNAFEEDGRGLTLTQRKSSLGSIVWKKEHVNHLQKELFRFEINKETNRDKLMENSEYDPYLHRNIQSIDSEVRKLLNDFKSSNFPNYKEYLKKEKKIVESPQPKKKTKFVTKKLKSLLNAKTIKKF